MSLVKIIVDYQPQEGWQPGDVVDITNPEELIRQGLVVPVDGSVYESQERRKKEEVSLKQKQDDLYKKVNKAREELEELQSFQRKQEAVKESSPEVDEEKKADLKKRRVESLKKARAVAAANRAKRKLEVTKKIREKVGG